MQTASAFGFFGLFIYLGTLAIGIYCLILFIKLARRGIKALDIYLNKHNDRGDYRDGM
ncbi:hypothetical protein [Paenibacillus urinalis]|uniref:DUF4083 domain-containing protein n=1 Tax=Paenibacillus urinalis TaxID=521520 RepID=A0AAX3N4X2_9BACL|nr:hypothetical protein [Paenibacillus urinalis]WDH84079.1 hypothetical protein PUW23_07650 [Paenibacillus urinalis]